MIVAETIIGASSAGLTALFVFLGTRFVAKQTRAASESQVEVDQRKVDQESFDRFVARYEADRNRLEVHLKENQSLLRAALRHINLLRSEMRARRVPPPPLPEELLEVPWDIYDPAIPDEKNK